jgi:hypothetical protein
MALRKVQRTFIERYALTTHGPLPALAPSCESESMTALRHIAHWRYRPLVDWFVGLGCETIPISNVYYVRV